ncbi:nuclear transport factor 2 family protein [Sphingomonas sp. SM33]|uniref:Nuclear transport factor 2 family protein n=1 Tax=Sphingomonas telluris TaxID=2907998 RepID=A0ABS9VMT0_9SPHN|nr:nuclear transport factor 2 family protein [Sphingomonas telluris]
MDASCELIQSLENEWRDALLSRDIDGLRSLIHPRFVLIGTRASGPFIINREEWLAAVQQREIVTIDLEIRESFVSDEVMVGTVWARWKVKYFGGEIEDCVLLTDVWVKEEDRWQVVRRHSSPAPPGCKF